MNKSHYLAFVLSDAARTQLIQLIAPKYDRIICHHVTLRFDLSKGLSEKEQSWIGKEIDVYLTGILDDDKGVQCLPVTVDGEQIRPDGSFYHVTHSLSADRKPVESNKLNLENVSRIRGRIQIHGVVSLVKK